MKRLFLAVVVVALSAFVVRAQQEKKSAPEWKEAVSKGKMGSRAKWVVEDYKPKASEFGKKAKCPVTGEGFTVGAETKAVKYKGKVYYFCCASCAPRPRTSAASC